ncbi:hypothetical protein ACN38_g6450 [Penicillium nordicum]|uniref:Uncharacterized protein n=1 Tax=Penicillium nordicum TaxID=229535 RepID=A0A0M8P838_9EURO|nr:hypothetical protein ACN38_g6450 [Penicillium nordicum]
MFEELPPSGPGGGRHDGGSTVRGRDDEVWRSMHRNNASQAVVQVVNQGAGQAFRDARDARVTTMIMQGIQPLDHDSLLPSATRGTRVAELTAREMDVGLREGGSRGRYVSQQDGRGGYRGGRSRGADARNRGAIRRGGRRGNARMDGRGRGTSNAGVADAPWRNPSRRDAPWGNNPSSRRTSSSRRTPPWRNHSSRRTVTQQYPDHGVAREAAREAAPRETWSWAEHQARVEEMTGKKRLIFSFSVALMVMHPCLDRIRY